MPRFSGAAAAGERVVAVRERHGLERTWRVSAGQQTVVRAADDRIALARARLEDFPVDDAHASPRVRDPARRAEHLRRNRDARTPDAEHLRQEEVHQVEIVARYPVVRRQEPTRTALYDAVLPVTGRRLRREGEERLTVLMQVRP